MDQEQNKTSQEEKEYASQLKQSLKIARTGVGLTNYRGSKGYQAMGMAATGADAFKEGRGLKGATKDIAISEVKRRITRSVLKKLGLEAIATEINTVEQGVQLGFHLREEINEGKFKNFIIVLILSLVKDFIDLASLGTFGIILNLFITPALFIVFFLQTPIFKKYLIKRFLWPYILSIIIEFIPGFNIFPSYTISTILLKLKIDKKIKELEEAAEEIEKETKTERHQ